MKQGDAASVRVCGTNVRDIKTLSTIIYGCEVSIRVNNITQAYLCTMLIRLKKERGVLDIFLVEIRNYWEIQV